LNEMVRPQVKLTDRVSWGLGWAIDRTPVGGDVISHSGDNPGFKTLTAASIQRKSAFMIMTNGDRGFDDVITKVVTSDLMQQFLPVNLKA